MARDAVERVGSLGWGRGGEGPQQPLHGWWELLWSPRPARVSELAVRPREGAGAGWVPPWASWGWGSWGLSPPHRPSATSLSPEGAGCMEGACLASGLHSVPPLGWRLWLSGGPGHHRAEKSPLWQTSRVLSRRAVVKVAKWPAASWPGPPAGEGDHRHAQMATRVDVRRHCGCAHVCVHVRARTCARAHSPGARPAGSETPVGPRSICTFNPETVGTGSPSENKMSSVCRASAAAFSWRAGLVGSEQHVREESRIQSRVLGGGVGGV